MTRVQLREVQHKCDLIVCKRARLNTTSNVLVITNALNSFAMQPKLHKEQQLNECFISSSVKDFGNQMVSYFWMPVTSAEKVSV